MTVTPHDKPVAHAKLVSCNVHGTRFVNAIVYIRRSASLDDAAAQVWNAAASWCADWPDEIQYVEPDPGLAWAQWFMQSIAA